MIFINVYYSICRIFILVYIVFKYQCILTWAMGYMIGLIPSWSRDFYHFCGM